MLHPVLKRQLKKLGISQDSPPDGNAWARFIEKVNVSYEDADLDRYTLERSLGLSNEEMRDLTLKLEDALEQLRKLSMTDELTGLMNRRFLNASILEEVAQVTRNYRNINEGRAMRVSANLDMAFVMVDLDHFKSVNDTYGHAAGDRVLVQMRHLLTVFTRDTDTVIRWGGEEFLIVARNICRTDYMALCERIRRGVAAHRFDIEQKDPIPLTCSMGAAVFPFLTKLPEALSWERVVEVADACLYAAKRSGRNAWVGVLPTDLASLEDLASQLDKRLPDLVAGGKLDVQTSLPNVAMITWSD